MKQLLSRTLSAVLLLSACSPMIDSHGPVLDPDKTAMLKPGETSYTEVLQLMGSPTFRTAFDTETWLYIQSKQERMAFFKPTEFEREILVLTFDKNGTLAATDKKTLADGRDISPSPEKTSLGAQELSALEQIIGNIGRFGQEQAVR